MTTRWFRWFRGLGTRVVPVVPEAGNCTNTRKSGSGVAQSTSTTLPEGEVVSGEGLGNPAGTTHLGNIPEFITDPTGRSFDLHSFLRHAFEYPEEDV